MKTVTIVNLMLLIVMIAASATFAQSAKKNKKQKNMKSKNMNTYVIERQIPDAGKLTAEQLQGISQKSCGVLDELGPDIEWVHSYVTGDKIFCIYRAQNEEILRTHAQKGGFPINSVNKVSTVISPETATAKLETILK